MSSNSGGSIDPSEECDSGEEMYVEANSMDANKMDASVPETIFPSESPLSVSISADHCDRAEFNDGTEFYGFDKNVGCIPSTSNVGIEIPGTDSSMINRLNNFMYDSDSSIGEVSQIIGNKKRKISKPEGIIWPNLERGSPMFQRVESSKPIYSQNFRKILSQANFGSYLEISSQN